MKLTLQLNGRQRTVDAGPGDSLLKILRGQGLTSVRDGCDGEGSCGACGVQLDGRMVNSCKVRALQVEGREVTTIEAHSPNRALSALQSAFLDAGIVQCGYCSPAMLLATHELFDRTEEPSRADIQDALSGTFCRCTGYEQVFNAVDIAGKRLRDPDYVAPDLPDFREDNRYVGKSVRKVDGPNLVRGGAAFVDDFVRPGHCYLKMLRSPFAHAYIKSIDTSRAEALDGVVLVATHKNTPDIYYTQAGQGFPEPSPYDRKMFGCKVRHVGDRVAAVVAETEQIALEAISLIDVEYEALGPVLDVDQAAAPDAPVLHGGPVEYVVGAPDDLDNSGADPRDGKVIYQFPIHGEPHRNIAAHVEGGIGDIDEGLSEADVIIDQTYESSQIQCTALEPHVVYSRMDGDRLVLHASTQVPFHVRRIIARLLDVPENRIRVIKERTGGAFGSKQDMVLEEVAAWCTWQTGRDILFRFTREEVFIASRTRHTMRIRVRLGARRDGTFTAMDMQVDANTGPYGGHCLTVPMNACSKALPLFICDNAHFDVTTYYTNIPPTGAYQGYGAPKGSFAMQMAVAEMAEALGMDQLALIEKNRVREGSWLQILECLGEGRPGIPQTVYTCGLGPALERGAELIEWGKAEQSDDPFEKVGKGMCIVQQGSGLPGLDSANAVVSMFGDGTMMLLSGAADLGTGLDTVTTKMVAEVLEMQLDDVSVISGDTDTTPFDVGAYASSGTYFSGGAAANAAKKMKAMILDVAEEMLVEPSENLELAFPSRVCGKSGEVTFEQIARYTQSGTGRGQLIAHGVFITDKGSFPYGAHFAQVAVNTRTGRIHLQKYFALQDAGTPVNPQLALGQIYGGALKTIGHSMYEEMVLDENGRCLNANFGEYRIPRIGDLPDVFVAELVDTDDPFGPFGGKSIAEVSCNGAAPAIASAIHDACGIWLRAWPFSPESVLDAIATQG